MLSYSYDYKLTKNLLWSYIRTLCSLTMYSI